MTVIAEPTQTIPVATTTQATTQGMPTSPAPSGGRPVPRWWRDVTGGAMWASGLFVIGLWVNNGGLIGWGTLATALTSLGRLTGLLASVTLLWQVFTMARVPMVEQAWGQDELSRLHRIIGFSSFSLMLAHIVLIVAGYAGMEQLGIIATFVDEVLHSPGMLLALAGALALVMVCVTSIKKARRRLRYESWHLLHLYAYLGAGLALPHQLWTGADFLASPVSTVFWWGIYIAAVASVLVFRVGLPLVRSRRHQLVVDHVALEAPGVVSVTVRGRDLQRLPVRAGQFFQWRFLDGPGWSRGNPYSLSAAPDGQSLRITAAIVGDSTARLTQLQPGTKVLVEGPYGRLHGGVRTRSTQVLLGSGIGITPMRALLEDLARTPGDTVVIYRARSQAEAVLLDELREIASHRGARVVVMLGHRVSDRPSWLPESLADLTDAQALAQIVPDVADRDVYICGPVAWMDAASQAAADAGVPPESIHVERFTY